MLAFVHTTIPSTTNGAEIRKSVFAEQAKTRMRAQELCLEIRIALQHFCQISKFAASNHRLDNLTNYHRFLDFDKLLDVFIKYLDNIIHDFCIQFLFVFYGLTEIDCVIRIVSFNGFLISNFEFFLFLSSRNRLLLFRHFFSNFRKVLLVVCEVFL